MHTLETIDLCHHYRNQPILDHVSVQVPEGSIYGFLGPNGAGKTTTLRLVLGLLRKQKGSIRLFGLPLDAHRIDILRRVGSLIESPSSYDHLTAAENLRVLNAVHRFPDRRICEVLELVGLGDTGTKKAREFSLGMKQRLGLAAALLASPSMLILDEPTNGLDPNGILEMRRLLIRLNREHGVTIVVSSHLLAEVEKLATHLGIIHHGRLVFQGPLEALRNGQHRAQSIRIGTNDPMGALPLVSQLVPEARIAGDLIIVPAQANDRLSQINRLLVEHRIDVHALHPVSQDLESIFMSMVGGASA